jgi:hypothetical protein
MSGRISVNPVEKGLVYIIDGANYKSISSGENVVKDLTENDYDANLINDAQWVSDGLGSLRFDGTDDYAFRPYTSGDLYDINTTGEITIDTWVRFDDILGPYNSIVSFGRPFGNHTAGHYQWEIMKLNTNFPSAGGDCRILFAVSNLIDAKGINLITNDGNFNPSTPLPQDNIWFNLTFTYSYSAGDLTPYYNGEGVTGTPSGFISPLASPPQIPAVAYRDLNIGAASDLSGAFSMTGNIASIRIYNRVLSSSEVEQNYRALESRFK